MAQNTPQFHIFIVCRELKNKETGIDLSVTSYTERKSMLGSVYEYQVMVASNLPVFKSAKHKDTDNVQFTVSKQIPTLSIQL